MSALTAPFAVLDIEAMDWDRWDLGGFVTSTGDEEVCETPERLARLVERFKGRVFAHYGGRYDLFFLPRPSQLTMSGSGILRAQIGRASVWDTWFLFQMSLKKIGKAVGREKFEDKSDRMHTLTREERAAHCLNDCHVLRVALESHRAWIGERGHPKPSWPATAGGTAVHCLEALEPEGVGRLKKELVSLDHWLDWYGAVTGGRVELWQHGTVKDVHTYDINSSYPQSWCDAPLPLGPWEATGTERPKRLGVYLCELKQSRESLPICAPNHVWRYDGEAWCTSEEIEVVRASGGTVEIKRGWVSTGAPQFFGQQFVTTLYGAKQRGDVWAKVGVNSGHGKLSQGLLQSSFVLRGGRYERDFELTFPAWYQRPLIGAFLLARARVRLWRVLEALKRAGFRVYYCDTDSVHTNCPPENFPGILGPELGQWKHEGRASEACYVAPKVYGLQTAEGLKLAAKGLPKKQVTWDVLRDASRGETVVLQEKAGLVAFRSQTEWGPKVAHKKRALMRQAGGKRYVAGTNRLSYRDT